jgi:hypothetical protein
MKQNKLLLTSALVGTMALSGAALAEVSGSVTSIIAFGSDEGTSTATGSDNRTGSEVNINFKNSADLDNGMKAAVKGKLEFNNNTSDQEFEMTVGTDSVYFGLGTDAGHSVRGSTLPFLGYVPGTLAEAVSAYGTEAMDLLGENEASNVEHISLNAKIADLGLATVRYAPNSGSSDDASSNVTAGTSGSRTEFVFSGSPIEGLKILVGQNEQQNDTANGDAKEKVKKYSASYNFGQFALGVERQNIQDENFSEGDDATLTQYAATFAASDKVTIGLTHSVSEDEDTSPSGVDEEITTLELGYNLGGMSVIASYVKAEGMSHTNNQDADGLVLRTSMGF